MSDRCTVTRAKKSYPTDSSPRTVFSLSIIRVVWRARRWVVVLRGRIGRKSTLCRLEGAEWRRKFLHKNGNASTSAGRRMCVVAVNLERPAFLHISLPARGLSERARKVMFCCCFLTRSVDRETTMPTRGRSCRDFSPCRCRVAVERGFCMPMLRRQATNEGEVGSAFH